MNNDENGYYMPIYMCKLCGEILVGVKRENYRQALGN